MCGFVHLRGGVGPLDQGQQSDEELARASGEVVDLDLAFHVRFAGQSGRSG